jgi:hypothetical protein
MWVPVPGLLDEEGPRAWPGRARVGVDIIVVWALCMYWRLMLCFKR